MRIVKHVPKEDYYYFLETMPLVCVDLCIIRSEKILLVKRKNPPALDRWWFPGGRIRKGELMRDTVKRIAISEVGLDFPHYVGRINVQETIFEDGPDDIPIHSINVVYCVVAPQSYEVKLDSDHADYKWINGMTDTNGLHPYVIESIHKRHRLI